LARATLLAARGRLVEASTELHALAQAAPRHAEVRFALAFVALARGEPTRAEASAKVALELRKPYPEARLVHAEALARLGRDADARRTLEQFLDEAPEHMAAERERVRALLRDSRSTRIDMH
jgi:Flp pilus assembly protein TadD